MSEIEVDSFDKNLGKKIRNLRIMSGMSQQNVADLLGVSFQQVQKYERGTNRITAKTLYVLARVFHIAYADFFDGLNDVELNELEIEMKPLRMDVIYALAQLTKEQVDMVQQVIMAFLCVNNDGRKGDE